MQHHRLPFQRLTPAHDRRRPGAAHQGVLAAIVAMAFCAWLVVVQQEAPELDASTARESLAVLDELLAANGSDDR